MCSRPIKIIFSFLCFGLVKCTTMAPSSGFAVSTVLFSATRGSEFEHSYLFQINLCCYKLLITNPILGYIYIPFQEPNRGLRPLILALMSLTLEFDQTSSWVSSEGRRFCACNLSEESQST